MSKAGLEHVKRRLAGFALLIVSATLGSIALFVSQLFNPTFIWLLSGAVFLGAPALGLLSISRGRLVFLCFIGAILINLRSIIIMIAYLGAIDFLVYLLLSILFIGGSMFGMAVALSILFDRSVK